MKLHLPLSLRSALLAACALMGIHTTANAASSDECTWQGEYVGNYDYWANHKGLMSEDFKATDGAFEMDLCKPDFFHEEHLAVEGDRDQEITQYDNITKSIHSFRVFVSHNATPDGPRKFTEGDEVSLNINGNNRKYSYTVDIQNGNTVAWIICKNRGTVIMEDMKDILINGVNYSATNGMAPSHAQGAENGNAPNHSSHGFNNLLDITITNSDSFTYTNNDAVSDGISEGTLSTGGDVFLSGITKVNISSNKKAVMYDGTFTMSDVDSAVFNGNKSYIFSNKGNSSGVEVAFNNVKTLTFSNNEDSIFRFHGIISDALPPSFTGCGTILFENNTADKDGIISVETGSGYGSPRQITFEDCLSVIFDKNTVERDYLFRYIIPTFKNVGEVRFSNNASGSGTLLASGLDFSGITKGIYITGNSATYTGTGAARPVLLPDKGTITAVGSASAKPEFVISGNKGFGKFNSLWGSTLTASYFDKLEISENELHYELSTTNMLGDLALENINTISISGNKLSAKGYLNGIVGFTSLTNFNTLTIQGNKVGFNEEGAVVGRNQGTDVTCLFSKGSVIDGLKSGTVNVLDNEVSTSSRTGSGDSTNTVTLSNLLALNVQGNTIENTGKWLGTLKLSNVKNVAIQNNSYTVSGTSDSKAAITLSSLDLSGIDQFIIEGNRSAGDKEMGGALALKFDNNSASTISGAKLVQISGNSITSDTVAYGAALRIVEVGSQSTHMLKFENNKEINILNNIAQAASLTNAHGGAISDSGKASGKTLEFIGNDKVLIRGNGIIDEASVQLNAIDIDGSLTFKSKAGQSAEVYDGIKIGESLNINGDNDDKNEAYVGTVTFSGLYTDTDLNNILKAQKGSQAKDLQASRTIQAAEVHVYNGTLNLEEGIRLVATNAKGFTSDKIATVQMKNATLHMNSNSALVTLPTAVFEGHNVIEANSVTASNGTWTFKVGSMNQNESILNVEFSGTKGKITMDGQTFQIDRGSDLESGQYMLMEFDQNRGSWIGSDKITFAGTETSALGSEGEDDIYYTVNDGAYTLWYEYTKEEQNPNLPDTPTQPDDPTLPDTPTQPDDPTLPDTPTQPDDPTLPDEPTQPDDPTLPDTPTQPNDPTLPDTPTQPEKPAQRGAATLTWIASTGTWAESAGASKGTWYNKDVKDLNFYKGDSVVFNQDADVTVKGIVRPADVKVTNEEGQVILRSEDGGQITGKTSLTKTGAGELVLELDNAYEGGTTIEEGKLTVKKLNALGLGSVQLKGGELDLTDLAVSNDVIATGEAVFNGGSAYKGTLTLDGGKLTGEVINVEEIADLRKGSIANGLTGTGKVEKNGKGTVTLSGTITPKGGTVVNEGTLILNGATYSGKLTVNEGGKLSVSNSSFAAYISMHEGSAIKAAGSGLSLAKGTTLASDGASFEGNLIMAGGTLKLSAPQNIQGDVTLSGGIVELSDTLTVSGNLSATEVTQVRVDVQKLVEEKKLTLFTAADASGVENSLIYLTDLQDARINAGVEDNMKDFVLELNNAVLVWQPGTTGNWGVKDAGEWGTDKEDKRFYNLDEVVFDSAGEITIIGEVNPSKITVKGDKDTAFAGEGSLIGTAALTKSGKGTLTMGTDNSSYKGDISVNGGTLSVNNEHALGSGNVFVSGAKFNGGYYNIGNRVTFSGNSAMEHADGLTTVVFADNAKVDGNYTLATGNTLTIGSKGAAFTGDFTFAGGTLKLTGMDGTFDLSKGHTDFDASDLVKDATSSLTTIDISDWTDITYGKAYALISMITDETAADQFIVTGANRYKLSYADDTLWITFQRPELNKKIADQLTSNQRAAYEALDAVLKATEEGRPNDDDVLRKLADETLAAEDAATAAALLNRLNGAELATTMTSQMEGNMAHLRRLRSNMGSGQIITKDGRGSAYVIGYDDLQRIDDNAKGQGIRRSEWGGTLGFEHAVRNQSLIGIALSNGRATVEPTDGNRYHEDTARVDFYAVADLGRGWQSVTSVGIGAHSFDLTRNLPGGYHTLTSMDGISLNVLEEISYTIRVNEANSVQPFFAVESSINNIDSFTEQGASTASLAGGSQSAWAMDVTVGARFIHTFTTYSGLTGSVNLQAGFIASLGDTSSELNLHFVGAPKTSFSVSTADRNHLGYNLSAGVLVPVTKHTSISISAGAIMRGDSEEASASVGVRVKF